MSEEKHEYVFPCGRNVLLNVDTGHAFGMGVSKKDADKDETTRQWGGFEQCRECTLDCKKTRTANCYNKEHHTSKMMEVVSCVGYSKEYLENKGKETVTYLDTDDVGEYVIELIIQNEDYRTVRYLKGKSRNCGLLALIDDTILEQAFEKDYDKETNEYSLWMTNVRTGQTNTIEYDGIDEILDKIVSVRFLQINETDKEN